MMKLPVLTIFVAVLAAGVARPADDSPLAAFSGQGNGQTDSFRTDGPWLLDWTVTSEQPLLAMFEIRLHDGETNEFLGSPVEILGTGNGVKLFDREGSYRLAIAGRNAEWQLEISEVTEEEAAELRRLQAGQPTLEDRARAARRNVPEGSFNGWQARGEDGLLLFGDDGLGWRVTLMAPCRGLGDAEEISFVTPVRGDVGAYNSILLEDGTRCYFESVVPTLTN